MQYKSIALYCIMRPYTEGRLDRYRIGIPRHKETIHGPSFFLMGTFFMWACMQSFLSTWGSFSPCGRSLSPYGGLFFHVGVSLNEWGSLSPHGRGPFLGLPSPNNFFCGSLSHFLLHKYL